MVRWNQLFNTDGRDTRHAIQDQMRHLLPAHRDDIPASPIPAKTVTKIALRLKHMVEEVIPCELEEDIVTKPHSPILTQKVIKLATAAGDEENKGCVVFCLLICKRWFWRQAQLELWDADLHNVRGKACEVLAKRIIEAEEDQEYLLEEVLLKRYSILKDGEDTVPTNAIEKAVDLHALDVIGSSGYQKCISYLWRGWLVQDDEDPSRFIDYKEKTNTNYWVHFDPDRMRVPLYQNVVQMGFSFIYLVLYTGAISTINPTGDLDIVEIILYIFTVGFICDEVAKFWKVGRMYIGFWNVFNSTLYALLTVSFVMRMIALGYNLDSDGRQKYNELSYNFLAFSAPMFWMRLLLYLDSFRFFGAMLVVLKVMMKESIIFFALLIVVLIGFLQAFIGMDQADNNLDATNFILQAMANAIMQSPDFEGFDNFAPPFGLILYYIFTFVIMVVLLNILIALYGSAYSDITDNAVDEYMALFSHKTMQFVRAPDENVFIAPFNLIELCCLVIPFEWWLPRHHFEHLNDIVMGIIYSPVLLVTAALETKQAHTVKSNRTRGEEDDDTVEEWEQLSEECDFEGEGWTKKVMAVCPNVEVDQAVIEVRELKTEVLELKKMIEKMAHGDPEQDLLGDGDDEGLGQSRTES